MSERRPLGRSKIWGQLKKEMCNYYNCLKKAGLAHKAKRHSEKSWTPSVRSSAEGNSAWKLGGWTGNR